MTIQSLEHLLAKVLRLVLAINSFLPFRKLVLWFRRVYWRASLGTLGRKCRIYPRVIIHAPKLVKLGDQVSIAEFVHIWGGGGVTIGSRVMIASHSAITSQTHGVDMTTRRDNISSPVFIGDDVWIGSGAIILPGVTIGHNSVIAAGSVVTRDIAANSLAMGVPAKVVSLINN